MLKTKLYTGLATQEIDRLAIEDYGYQGFALMSEAGQSAFELLSFKLALGGVSKRLLVLCGAGNNGGDGYVLAKHALQQGHRVEVVALAAPKTPDSKRAQSEFHQQGGATLDFEAWESSYAERRTLDNSMSYDVIVDALLGIGLKTQPRESYAKAIEFANEADGFKYALDVPSGLDADTGQCFEPCFRADLTITFIAPKIGLMTGAALDHVGELHLETLNIEAGIVESIEHAGLHYDEAFLAPRKQNSHKGVYGHALIVGGDKGMFGAALLAGEATLRAGAGKVSVLSSQENLDKPALYLAELMSLASDNGEIPESALDADVIGLGPGLGQSEWSCSLFENIVSLKKALVLDADALTLLARQDVQFDSDAVLTPHPGEAASLLNLSTAEVQIDRVTAAREIARRYNAVCVLKGAGTIIADPQGDCYLCSKGTPAMASAGMGDVLTGITTALLAQGLGSLEAALTAVWWHGATAEKIVNERNVRVVLASDVARNLKAI